MELLGTLHGMAVSAMMSPLVMRMFAEDVTPAVSEAAAEVDAALLSGGNR